MDEPLRVGVIGMIAQAHAAALRFLTDDGLVRTVAAADPDPMGIERVEAIAGALDHRYPWSRGTPIGVPGGRKPEGVRCSSTHSAPTR